MMDTPQAAIMDRQRDPAGKTTTTLTLTWILNGLLLELSGRSVAEAIFEFELHVLTPAVPP